MELNKDYVCIPDNFLSDKELSMTSRGLAATIYAYVFDGQVKTFQELMNVLNRIDDEDVVDAAWEDLENRGYLEDVKRYFEMNKPDRSKYYIFPEGLLRDEKYKWISADAKLFYGFVLDYINQTANNQDLFDIREIEYSIKKKDMKMLTNCGLLNKIPGKRYLYSVKRLMEE